MHSYDPVLQVSPLLGDNDPEPFEIVNRHGGCRAVITCDHASRRIPERLGDLGLDDTALGQHIAWDIGCANVSRRLSELLDAPLILGGFSRLVIDLNRHLTDPSSIPAVSDNVHVPGNANISHMQANRRTEELFVPYHNALAALLGEVHESKGAPLIIAMHSFTPVFANFERPWHVGILWNEDDRVSAPLLDCLRQEPGLVVGDNQPYHAREPVGYGMDVHAERNRYPHALIEIRQDLIEDDTGAVQWAERLAKAFTYLLNHCDIYRELEVAS